MAEIVTEEFLNLFEQAGQLHGHKCPSLYYGVKGLTQLLELAAQKKIPLDHLVLEGKSKCIRDGAKVALNSRLDKKLELIGQGCAFTAGNRKNNIRLEVRREVRQMVNKLNETLPLDEYQRTGTEKLQSLTTNELFNIGQLAPEEFDHLLAQVENVI